MSQHDETTTVTASPTPTAEPVGRAAGTARPSTATIIGTAALVLWPVAAAVGSTFGSLIEGSLDPADPSAYLDAVAANPGSWAAYSLGMLVMALLVAASVPAVWRLTVERTPAWAWASAVLGALFFMGLSVHLMSWPTLIGALAASEIDPAAAMSVVTATDGQWFFWVIFAPFLLGSVLAPLVAGVALFRGRLIPVWSLVAVVLATVVQATLGTTELWQCAVYAVLMLVAYGPALVTVLRRRRG